MIDSDVPLDDIRTLLPDWERHLRSAKKQPATIDTYLKVGWDFARWLLRRGRPTTIRDIDHVEIETYLIALGDRPNMRTGKPITAAHVAKHYRHLKQFFRWLHEVEQEIDTDPFAKIKPPQVADKDIPIIPDDYLTKLLATCKTNSFEDRRDTAILRFFLDTGVRAGGLAGLHEADLNYEANTATITLKGGRTFSVPFGARTADALRRYQRVRARHPAARETALWLGRKGPITQSGITQVLNRRVVDAGLPHLHPHQFRHTFAHKWLVAEGNETDLMRLMGWSSREMVTRYARSASEERARAAHQKKALGDRV